MKHEIEQLDQKELRKFGLVTGAIVVVLFGLLLPWLLDHAWPYWPWYIAGVLWVLALVFPSALNPIYHGWMRFGLVLGWINTRIILGLMFYIIFTPISLVLLLLGKDPMHRKKESALESYRVTTKKQSREHMERPY
jgi:predicted anti-sigma-YlaC factor YlaD